MKKYYVMFRRTPEQSPPERSGPFALREEAVRCGLAYAALGYSFEIVEI